MQSEITFETTETNWVCMIVFLCAHVRISISTYILTRINIIYLPYRLTSKTPLGVVFLFMLVNWLVEKHQLFYSTFTNVFFFGHVFLRFLTFFIFFWNVFFTSMVNSFLCEVANRETNKHRPMKTLPPWGK